MTVGYSGHEQVVVTLFGASADIEARNQVLKDLECLMVVDIFW